MRRRVLVRGAAGLVGAAAVTVAALAGCGAQPTPVGDGPAAGSITVLAAASLTQSFTTLGRQFEATHPGTTVTFSFGASSALAEQVNAGAPADVFASASVTNMQQVVARGNAADPVVFARNRMAIAVPPSNPGKVSGLGSLAAPGVKVALCQPQVPCGALAQQVFANAGLEVTPVTLESDVAAVLTKVTLGEVDAGLVYVTDVEAAGDAVAEVPVPDDVNASTSYPIAALTHAPNPALAAAFTAYVLSPEGRQVLSRAGFAAP